MQSFTPQNGKKLKALARRLDCLETRTRGRIKYAIQRLLDQTDDLCEGFWTDEEWSEYRWEPFRFYQTPNRIGPEQNKIRRRLWAKYRDAVVAKLMECLTMKESQRERLVECVVEMREALDAYIAAHDEAQALLEEVPREHWPDEWTPWEER